MLNTNSRGPRHLCSFWEPCLHQVNKPGPDSWQMRDPMEESPTAVAKGVLDQTYSQQTAAHLKVPVSSAEPLACSVADAASSSAEISQIPHAQQNHQADPQTRNQSWMLTESLHLGEGTCYTAVTNCTHSRARTHCMTDNIECILMKWFNRTYLLKSEVFLTPQQKWENTELLEWIFPVIFFSMTFNNINKWCLEITLCFSPQWLLLA